MNTFDERKKAFEAKFLQDEDLKFKLRARRNKRIAEWAAELIGKPNDENYIKEVKPYKTNIREYVSSYEKVIPSSSVITDFDLPARYDDENQITPSSAKLVGTALTGIDTITSYPDKHWLENVGFKIVSFNIGEKGSS